MKSRRRQGAVTLLMARELGNQVICQRCGATMLNYDTACLAELDDQCPGWGKLWEVAYRVMSLPGVPRR